MPSVRLANSLGLLILLAAAMSALAPGFSLRAQRNEVHDRDTHRLTMGMILILIQGGLLIASLVLVFLVAARSGRRIAWGWSAPALALAAGGLGTALASLVYSRHVRLAAGIMGAILMGLALGVWQSAPTAMTAYAAPQWPLTMTQAMQAGASGWLMTAALERSHNRLPRAVGGVLALHTGALLLLIFHAQRAWGQGWSWDPLECWAVIPWLCTAMVGVMMEHLAPQPRHRASVYPSAAFAGMMASVSLAIAVAAPYVLHMAAIGSRYLR
jgi:hypothetical protein